MHNLCAIFAKYIDICKLFAGILVNKQENFLVSQAALPTLNVEDGKAIHEIAVSLVTLKCTDVLDDVLIK